MKGFFLRPGFEDMIKNSRFQNHNSNEWYGDIQDGAMWTEQIGCNGLPFCFGKSSISLNLNIDWFQPFDNISYSCGVIYMSLNNIPRQERYKEENILLVGIMPGGKEAKTDRINSYLAPLVDELLSLYSGVQMKTLNNPKGIMVNGALLLVACDIPACRKVCGFTSHASANACNKCNQKFKKVNGLFDFSEGYENFDRWQLRTKEGNRADAERWLNARTPDERSEVERQTGTRYSELHRLQYFDVVRQSTIDPMHNLLLGTCRRMVEHWKSKGFFSAKKLEIMQKKADEIQLPTGYESLKKKIIGNFSNMKADNWKSWCLIYSSYVLIGNSFVCFCNDSIFKY